MRQPLYRIGIFVLLLLTAAMANAQKDTAKTVNILIAPVAAQTHDTAGKLYVQMDTIAVPKPVIKIKNGKASIVYDTVPQYKTRARFSTVADSAFRKADSLRRKNDSLYKRTVSFKKISDSLYRKKDSLYKKSLYFKKFNDTLFRKHDSLFRKNDSLYKKAFAFKKMSDAAFRKNDSLYKRSFKKFNDSLFRKNQERFKFSNKSFRLDSLKQLNWKSDTNRLKLKLKVLESNLIRLKTDSLKLMQNKQKKLITKEVDCNKDGQLSIDNVGRKLTIKTTTGNKIKLEVVMFSEEGTSEKEVAWEKDLNIAVAGDRNNVLIRKAANDNSTTAAAPTPIPASYKSPLTVYVPAAVKIVIGHRYNELVIMDNLVNVELDLLNTKLLMKDAVKATIKSRYGSVEAGTIKEADLDLLNCSFSSPETEKLRINSKYSNVSVKNTGTVSMKSYSDHYNIDRAKNISGSKSFGQFNILRLDNSITLDGASADLRISKIDAAVKTIKVDNKYADVRLPVERLPNYSLQFNGTYSNIFTTHDTLKTGATDSLKAANPVFTKIAGDLKKEFTELIVQCNSCSVDFR